MRYLIDSRRSRRLAVDSGANLGTKGSGRHFVELVLRVRSVRRHLYRRASELTDVPRHDGRVACKRDSGDHRVDCADSVALLAHRSLYPGRASDRFVVDQRHLLHDLLKSRSGRCLGIEPHADLCIDERRNRPMGVGNLVEFRHCGSSSASRWITNEESRITARHPSVG